MLPLGGDRVEGIADLSVLFLQLHVNLQLYQNKTLIKIIPPSDHEWV